MSGIEIEYNNHTGWLCNNDLILVCDREEIIDNSFMDDNKLQLMNRTRRRYIPKVNFNDKKLFPSILNRTVTHEINTDDELLSELSSMLACREYVSKQNHFFDRKQFQQAQAAQADEEKKFHEHQKRQQEQSHIERQQRRRQHPLYVSRFDEKRYVPSIRKKLYKFHY
ncbi:unnamed protein product [Adineta steineri]|uniref:Uncharacterized protein n=1 Tax=Adineta steineri TaxID=433720 RepID=A0A819Q3T4_9BILA|nr:unnamed protein product [Adineta steineri]CAF4022581.1 unnamed protein product [Adineta steineri]